MKKHAKKDDAHLGARAREHRSVLREIEDAEDEMSWLPYDRQFPCFKACCEPVPQHG
jgi:hypothetical protein